MLENPITKLLLKFYRKYAPEAVKDEQHPMHWKEKLLYSFVFVSVPAGLYLLVFGMPGNIDYEYWGVMIVGGICYLGCLLLFFFPRARYELRAIAACLLVYLLGLALILDINPFLASREYLFAFSIIASILLGWPGAIISILINVATWIGVGWLIYVGYWEELGPVADALRSWHLVFMDLVFINVSITTLITLVFMRIEKSEKAAKRFAQISFDKSEKLTETNKRLAMEIEDRKAVTMALQESEEKYRTILENIKDAYFEVDLRGNLIFFNQALCTLLGYTQIELLGSNYRTYVSQEYSNRLVEHFFKVYRNGEAIPTLDVEIITRGNQVITLSLLVSPLTDGGGRIIGFRGLGRDITQQRAMETQLRHAQKMKAVGTLAGGVAHDLNNILSGIVNYPELLLMEMPQTNPMHKALTTIKSSGEKAVAIVQDLLTLARRGVAVKDVVNLNTIILEYLQSYEFRALQAQHAEVVVQTNLDEALPNVTGSSVHLSKTVMNMVANAAEAIDGPGILFISTCSQFMEATIGNYGSLAEGEYVVLTIGDTGSGIATEDLDKIFEPFFTKKVMGRSGTGLGMAVVWGTVKDHGGHIEVESTKGEGTTFTIYLPTTPEPAKTHVVQRSIDRLTGHGETVLVVDDVDTQREIAQVMLEKLGYKPTAVASGEAAVQYLQTNQVDLLVLDMIMSPGIGGLETYQRILDIHPNQKAVLASGYTETEQVREAQRLGAGRYLRKPYSLEQLGLAIRLTLEGVVDEERLMHSPL